jgi:hypothetical protein
MKRCPYPVSLRFTIFFWLYFISVFIVESVPLALICPFICGICCGVGKPPQDPDTLSVLAINIDDVTEVAGAEAYSKCGFDTSELKHM